ncbi:hypothetical protein [Pseudonocardia spinosispora]|uniref:hypothetical protein n=1 Tax=Pseudonocardia spinosispora TaxID=103441 RepID=UPI00040AAA75|nr:hypothetical protein [Pseudonocardia spinosispora]
MSDHVGKALDKGRKPEHLAAAAHEIGHVVGALANGGRPKSVRIDIGLFGGVNGGLCVTDEMPSAAWPRRRQLGRLVSDLAGHAAETRFYQLHAGMGFREAFKLARQSAGGDYENFRDWREEFGLRWKASEDWAFEQATNLLNRQGDYLDRYTVRLERARYLSGSSL